MTKSDIEQTLKNESFFSFDVDREKEAFMRRFYAADVAIPVVIQARNLEVKPKTSARYAPSMLLMTFAAIITAIAPQVITKAASPLKLKSPVLASLVISNDEDITDDPEFDLTLQKNGTVSEVVARNDPAKTALGRTIYDEKSDLLEVTNLILESTKSTDYLNINATKEAPNKINVLLTGDDDDVAVIKNYLSAGIKDYLQQNYVYAYLQDNDRTAEINKEDVAEADKYGLDYEKYALIRRIFSAISAFDDCFIFDQAFVAGYRDLSMAELTLKVNALGGFYEKMDIIKKLGDLDRLVRSKVVNYKDMKTANYAEWQVLNANFAEAYQSLTAASGTAPFAVDQSSIEYEEFVFPDFIGWLDGQIHIGFRRTESNSGHSAPIDDSLKLKYAVQIAAVKSEYEALQNFVLYCRSQEAAARDEIQKIIKDNSDPFGHACQESFDRWKELQTQREQERPRDDRNDEFYRDFERNFEAFFGWF